MLEIGCGHGIAVALVCEQVGTGKLTGIDRSEKMIEAAGKRNRACVEAGRAELRAVALDKADFGVGQFDTIFAINVNLFWTSKANELARMKAWLKPGGALYLFYQPPDPSGIERLTETITGTLTAHGFGTPQLTVKDLGKEKLIGFVAQPAGG